MTIDCMKVGQLLTKLPAHISKVKPDPLLCNPAILQLKDVEQPDFGMATFTSKIEWASIDHLANQKTLIHYEVIAIQPHDRFGPLTFQSWKKSFVKPTDGSLPTQ